MGMNAQSYQQQMVRLLPPGHPWQGEQLSYLLHGLAEQLAHVDDSAEQLLRECKPETALMLLDEWENALGLPECGIESEELSKRRQDAYAKDTADGGLSSWYYEALGARAGFEIEMDTAYGHHCESRSDAGLYHELSGLAPIIYSTAEVNRWTSCLEPCTEPVRVFGDGRLECLLNTYKPAHVRFVYAYFEPV